LFSFQENTAIDHPITSTPNILWELEQTYQRLLELSASQEECLSTGRWDELPSLLNQKTSLLEKTAELTTAFKQSGADANLPGNQKPLHRVAEILAALVETEERCSQMLPQTPKSQPKNAVIAAYAGGKYK